MPYNETGKLNVEVKYAPFSCRSRRAPLKAGIYHTLMQEGIKSNPFL